MSIEDKLRATLADRAAQVGVDGLAPVDTIAGSSARRRMRKRIVGGAGALVLIVALLAGLGSRSTEPTTSITIAAQPTVEASEADPDFDADPDTGRATGADDLSETTGSATAEEAPADPAEIAADALPDGFGRYLVARAGAGDRWQGDPVPGSDLATRVIPVFDAPDGPKRMLLEVNAVDGVETPLPLFNWTDHGSPTVLRVLEGEPGHSWVRVQAPTRPHDTGVWVRASDFHWAETTLRIEIDLANAGSLTVFDGSEVLFEAPIVQGRASRPTPVHVTYLEAGLLTEVFDPSQTYLGDAALTMASWSEELGTFGGGNSPINFLHGTNQPALMGQRVSSGEVRLTNDDIAEFIELVHPGVPIIMFDSSAARPDRDQVLATPIGSAATTPLVLNAVGSNATHRLHPQLWQPCDEPARVCLHPEPHYRATSFRYAIASDLDSDVQIPVFDEPGGPPRTALDVNDIDGVELVNPLYPRTVQGNPLVLRVLAEEPGWLKVQLPTRPNQSHAWVRASEFEVETTDVWVEVALAELPAGQSDAGELLLYRGDELVLRSPIVSGRESRPTALVDSWITQAVEGQFLAPAYGSWVIGLGAYSEALGTFGGGGLPSMAIHGTNQPTLLGQRVSSGNIRLTNDLMDKLVAAPGIIGAPVFVHDGWAFLDYPTAIGRATTTQPARTIDFDPDAPPVMGVPL